MKILLLSLPLLLLFARPCRAVSAYEDLLSGSPAQFQAAPAPVPYRCAHGADPLEPVPVPDLAAALRKLAFFNYDRSALLSMDRASFEKHRGYTTEKLAARVRDPLGQNGDFTQEYLIYRPDRKGPRPVVLVFPPFGGVGHISDWVGSYYAHKGYVAAVVLPVEDVGDTSRPMAAANGVFIRNIIMARLFIDYLETLPEVDMGGVYAFGISLGGINTALAFGVESRISKAVEVVGGGDIPGILAGSGYYKVKRLREAWMRAEGIKTPAELREKLTAMAVADPVDFGVLRRPEDLLMVIGHGDTFVPDQYQWKLFQAFSRPEEGRYPALVESGSGHIITSLDYKRYINLAGEFFDRAEAVRKAELGKEGR